MENEPSQSRPSPCTTPARRVWSRRVALMFGIVLLMPPGLVPALAQQAEAEVLLAQAILAYDDGACSS